MPDSAFSQQRIDELLSAQPPGRPLLQAFYTDPDVYAAELERLIYPGWFVAGVQSEWRSPGDYRVIEIADESVIVVMGDDQVLRAFANVCRHRGSRVCLDAQGSTRAFSCPYHGWRYDRAGRLTAARSMPDDFDASNYGLHEVSLANLHGVVLVCVSDAPMGLDGARTDLEAPLRAFGFGTLKVAERRRYPIPANWKLAVENYQECYHCATAHQEYARLHTLSVDVRRRAHLQTELEASTLPLDVIDRLDTKAPPGEMGYGYSRTALFDDYRTGSRDGQPVAPLLGDLEAYDGGASDFSFGGFSFMLAYSDHVVCYVFKPVDLENSECEITWLVRGDALESRDYDIESLTWLWDITMQSDLEIICNNYAGVKSRHYTPGEFSVMEQAEKVYVDWLLRELAGPQ